MTIYLQILKDDLRSIKFVLTIIVSCIFFLMSLEILSNSKFVAVLPIFNPDWLIVVNAGSITEDIDSLLKPTIYEVEIFLF